MPSNRSVLHDILIHRHSLQRVLRDALEASDVSDDKQEPCQGLLAGAGNMLTMSVPVTKNLRDHSKLAAKARVSDALFGIYFATTSAAAIDHEQIQMLADLLHRFTGQTPSCYLLLELGHQGRVDARAFSDAACTHSLSLQLQEDSDCNPAVCQSGGQSGSQSGDQSGSLYPVAATR